MAKRPRQDSTTQEQNQDNHEQIDVDLKSRSTKYLELDSTTSSPSHSTSSRSVTYRCLLPPHAPLIFPSYPSYETHYTSSHTNRCLSCHKNFPTAHFLSLHQTEHHDPIIASLRARRNPASQSDDSETRIYACFLSSCSKRCSDWRKRRRHLVDKHGFPRNYDFKVVESGIDGRWSMLRRGVDAQGHRASSRERAGRRGSGEGGGGIGKGGAEDDNDEDSNYDDDDDDDVDDMESESIEDDVENSAVGRDDDRQAEKRSEAAVDELAESMSSLQFVPRSVTFGRRKGKSGFAKQ